MILFPAIDLSDGKAVRLLRGDYNQKTVFSDDPLSVARDFVSCGATHVHLVDLDGAKDGTTPNSGVVRAIAEKTPLFCEIGGGVRSLDTAEYYFSCGVDRVILGTAAVTDPAFLEAAVKEYGEKIAVGADVKDGEIAIRGWTEKSGVKLDDFMRRMVELGVGCVIVTDISKDGAMKGTNRELYRELSEKYGVPVTASGGVSDLSDVIALRKLNLYGAIIGRAYYNGAIDLKEAIKVAQ
ncbi:MAG: 1-(5-phosphoribosyl)-5-[(5-phosphoribosylamino)methylideneamino]imidazole-4-carboxamide isomerase [Clostridia bacterium]|nr:1-(5-phosphoribosyl)-5-[(5-phosphoribosylamino)methylideneamino]imidazole-4-carboxamide isomerase [Clostridia bacterium]